MKPLVTKNSNTTFGRLHLDIARLREHTKVAPVSDFATVKSKTYVEGRTTSLTSD
jgi:hypothetical protein